MIEYYIQPKLKDSELKAISVLALAHVGDAVYELLVRTKLCAENNAKVSQLHAQTVSMVNASAQAAAVQKMIPYLTQEETAVFKRGKNAKVNSVPHNSSIADYHFATALETLFGWLYLRGQQERINQLFVFGLLD